MTTTAKPVLLSEIASVENFLKDLKAGRIGERRHPDDPELRIYSYTKKTQYGGLWTPETRLARGLMLHVPDGDFRKATVRGRGLPKFFTVEQIGSDWGRAKLVDDDENVTVEEAAEIPWDKPAIVAQKLNGALGLGYIDPSGEFKISTKGSFGSPEAEISNQMLATKYREAADVLSARGFTDSTLLFEIITPKRPHPVDYGDLEALSYLGSIDHRSGRWSPAEELDYAVELGFPYAEHLELGSLREAMEHPYEPNTEGFVVTIPGGAEGDIYKIKPLEYIKLRKLFYSLQQTDVKDLLKGLSPSAIGKIEGPEDIDLSSLVGDLELNDQMEQMLEKCREKVYRDYILPAQEIAVSAEKDILSSLKFFRETPDRAQLARHIKTEKEPQLHPIYFAALDRLFNADSSKVFGVALNQILQTS